MRAVKKVTLLRSGNRLVVDPATRPIQRLLVPSLTLVEKRFFHGWELKQRLRNGELPFETIEWECFGEDHKGRIGTSLGFWKRIKTTLELTGRYKVMMRDMTPHPNPSVYVPQWGRLKQFGIKLKHGQRDFLETLFANRTGRMDCPPGFGKSFLPAVVAILCPHAKIDIVSKRVAVVRDRIYPGLCQYLPDVGIVGGGKKIQGCRVMCYTSGSMHYAKGDSDFLFGDEDHELVSDETAGKFARWENSRNFGLSATHDMRLDNKDLRAEAIFGPIIYSMTYAEAEEHKMVVPIEVHWTSVSMDVDPCEGASDDIEKKRLAYWANDYRNDLIAKDARRYDDRAQVLVTCDTLEHAVNLKSRLPEYQLVYREESMTNKRFEEFVDQGLLAANEPRMSVERRMKLTKAFEKGRLKKAIVTTIWNVGVSFNQLGVLVRADGGGSPVNDVQIPGRTSRTSKGKFKGVVRDYMDQFNSGCRRKALNREKTYESQGWKQIFPKKAVKGSLRQQLFWEFEDD